MGLNASSEVILRKIVTTGLTPNSIPAACVTGPVLSPEHLDQIVEAHLRWAKLNRAAIVSQVDGWMTGMFGLVTLVFSFLSISGTVLGAGMAILGYLSLKASKELRQLDSEAPKRLARNQLLLGTLLLLYGAVSLYMVVRAPQSPALVSGSGDPEIDQMLAPFQSMAQTLYIAVYVGVILAAIIGPGLTALYYRIQSKRISTYLEQTPNWIIELQRRGMKI